MTYDTQETSVDQGEPYFLYLFDNGVDPVRLTSEPVPLTRMGESWTPSPVSHGEVEQTGNIEKQDLKLSFPLSDAFGQTFLSVASRITTVTVWRGHRNDGAEELRVYWKGRAVGARSGKTSIAVSVESIFTSLKRPGCRARFQRTCRHALYADGCELSRAAFAVAATVTAISGLTLTVPEAASAPAGDYTAGIIDFGGLFGFVENHVGDQVTLTTMVPGLAEAVASGPAAITIAPGCDRSITRCDTRFSNSLNHGGFIAMPRKNPFNVSIA